MPLGSADEVPLRSPSVQEAPGQPKEREDTQKRGQQRKVAPEGLKGGTNAPPPRMVGPTDNLTQVANAFSLRHKSLTTLVTVARGLHLTQSVEVSIGYYSPAGTQRITQSYVAGTGNRFLYNDKAADGKLRRMRADISLREPKPGGGFYTFSFPMQIDLDPLYDVAISPMRFSLISDCDIIDNSEIGFQWFSPDDRIHGQKFTTPPKTVIINGFAWTGVEVSVSHNLHHPVFWFKDRDPHLRPSGAGAPGGTNLVPGNTRTVKGNQKALDGSCQSYFEYTISYSLRWYPYL
jgi:hypothetical protein